MPMDGYGVFKSSRIPIDPEKVLRIHGYKDPAKTSSVIRHAAEIMGPRAEEILAPELHYRRLRILSLDRAELTVEGGIVFRSDAFPRFLSDAREVVVSVATMGAALDHGVGALLAESDLIEALFLETYGWLGINVLTAQFGGFLRERVNNEGYDVTCRLAPGYSYKVDGLAAGWALEQQREIFAAFEGIELPVALHQSCAMLPKISRTGMFGLIPS